MVVSELNRRITQYLFSPAKWARPEKVVALLQQKPDSVTQVNDVFIDLVAKSLSPKVMPPFFETFQNRLALLSQAEWQQLGIAVALLPFSGKITRSMDGTFRRAVKELAEPEVVAQIDALSLDSKPVFVGNWEDRAVTVYGAIHAVMNVCSWDPGVKEYTLLGFDGHLPEATIEQLTIEQIEVLCKISLPNHSWL